MQQQCEVLIVGAGPAGLTAAIYLARFRRTLRIIDDGRSRARYIPLTRNCPGFAHGVNGEALLAELREQAGRHGVRVESGLVQALERHGGSFRATFDGRTILAQQVVLATGVVDVLPDLPEVESAIRGGIVRLCAVCDAYETADRSVAVFGPPDQALRHAQYMRSFSRRVCAVASEGSFTKEQRRELLGMGAGVLDAVTRLETGGGAVRVHTRDGRSLSFEAFYPVLGARPRSDLARQLEARLNESGDLVVDAHQRTSVPGLYAIGDVVSALNQIAVGLGHAAVAATTIHNDLPHQSLPMQESTKL